MTTTINPMCHAKASSSNGRIPGMSNIHRCHNKAKVIVTKAGLSYPICGTHLRALRGRHGGGYGITVTSDRFDREARIIHIASHELFGLEPLVA